MLLSSPGGDLSCHPPSGHPVQRSPDLIQVLVVEPEATVARAIARLAFETVSHEPTILVGAASTVEGAKTLIDRASHHERARLVVLCAAHLGEGGSGVQVVRHASRAHADVRVVLITNGERDEILHGLRLGVDGIVAKPVALDALQSILRHVAESPRRNVVRLRVAGRERLLAEARAALEGALDSVELAEERLRDAGDEATEASRDAVQEARRLAAEAHRRVLEAERQLRGRREA